MTSLKFKRPSAGDFLAVLKERVEEERLRRGLTRFATKEMWLKVALIVGGYLFGVYLLYFGNFASLEVLLAYLFLGVVKGLNGLNIAHDANHGSLSNKAWVNLLFASIFDLSVTISEVWKVFHNKVHHRDKRRPLYAQMGFCVGYQLVFSRSFKGKRGLPFLGF